MLRKCRNIEYVYLLNKKTHQLVRFKYKKNYIYSYFSKIMIKEEFILLVP